MLRFVRVAVITLSCAPALSAQSVAVTQPFDSVALTGVHWRELGPYRGGRSVTAVGSVARPNEYYFGTTGGGVFKSTDGGNAWFPVTDRYFGGTIGAVAIAPSNPDIVWAGGGEYPLRGNVSHGDGVWKSTDGAKTWKLMGLAATKHIGDIIVHPTNPDLVYVAALGHAFGPNPDRGVYRSKDGGTTWEKILFRNDSTGAVDLVMDPGNPSVLYAGLWQVYRKPWELNSGGPGSGMFKTTDGGDHWTEITRNPGLPAGIWGDIGISVSAANSSRVYAIIEAKEGGVYRSDDAGATWQKANGESSLTQRAWYYMKIHADPKNQDVVYVNNVSFQKSTDAGKTFRPVRGMHHGDSHDLWIAPDNPNRMIETDDGGAEASTDGGKTWTDEDFATAQFYHVITTNHFPYHVCGAQQDNSTLCGPSSSPAGTIDIHDWKDAGGGESGWIAARADDPDVVYAGSYGALLTRKDLRNGLERNVNPWPDNPMGHPAKDLKYRFQWTFPIIVSPHNSNLLYAGSQHVHKSTNGGESWTVISPDLTYNDTKTQESSGGPLTLDQTSVEYYNTVFILEESPRTTGYLWAGTDDGRVWLTRNGGTRWTEVTPKDMQKDTRVSSIDASAHDQCVAYVAANRFQLDDDRPYLWKTANCGASWTRIDQGIASTEFTRVVREDPDRRGLLVAGTERGVWMSPNDGLTWQKLQLNLPIVPVHDLAFKNGDIVVATHGRSFWVLDNISTLRQLTDAVVKSDAYLFKPADAYRVNFGGGFFARRANPNEVPVNPVAFNPPSGPAIQYWLGAANPDVTLSILDSAGNVIRSFSSRQDSMQVADSLQREAKRRSREDSLRAAGVAPDSIQKLMRITTDAPTAGPDDFEAGFRPQSPPRAPNKRGVNTFNWDMRMAAPDAFRGMILWAAGVQGPMVAPGRYMARLAVNGKTVGTQSVRLLPDPRIKGVTQADYLAQARFLNRVSARFSDANDAVKSIRDIRSAVEDRRGKVPAEVRQVFDAHASALLPAISSVEDSVYQTKSRSGQDPLNYPIRINNKLGALLGVAGGSDGRPTAQTYEVFDLLSGQLDRELARLRAALTAHLDPINALLVQSKLPEIPNPYRKPIG
ncbi:MAG TPA: glycosyl hydrolase [Gemmatimonadaceae bacterium]|nr:glycosyl hydrolase [Gemmatimonadaceae bacterium]